MGYKKKSPRGKKKITVDFTPTAWAKYAIERGEKNGKAIVNYVNKQKRTSGSTRTRNDPGNRGRSSGGKTSFKRGSSKRYNTTGKAQGVLVAASRANDYSIQKKYAKNGSIMVIENGGTMSSPSYSALYPFQGPAVNQVCRSAFRALVKELARQRKTDIVNWTDPVGYLSVNSSNEIRFYYINNPGSTGTGGSAPSNSVQLATFSVASSGTYTWSQLADDLLAFFQNSLLAGDQTKELIKIDWRQKVEDFVGTTGVDDTPIAVIHTKQVKFDFALTTYLTVQNRTQAENAVGDGDQDESVDIENQPLVGRIYSNIGKWANYLELQNKGSNSSNQGSKPTVCHRDTGLALFEVGAEYADTMKIPPPGWVLGFKSDRKIVINPGSIYTLKTKFNCEMSLNKFLLKFAHTLGNASSNAESFKTEFGFVSGFGLEKLIDSTRSLGTNIAIGYQIKQIYATQIKYAKRSASNPFVEVATSQVNYSTNKVS